MAGWIEVDGAHDIPKLNIEIIKMIQTIGAQEVLEGNHVSDWNEMINYVNTIDTTNITNDQSDTLNSYGHKIESLLTQVNEPTDEPVGVMNYLFFTPNNPGISGLTGLMLPSHFSDEVEKTALTTDLYKITIPTLLQWGKLDFVVPPALGYSAFEKIGSIHKHLKIYEHSAHSPMSNEPELFVKDIIEFIELYK